MSSLISFIGAVLNSSTSILLAALGILIMQSSGVMNIGAEGMMLIGAFSGVLGSSVTGSAWGGVLFAVTITGMVGAFYGVCTIRQKANQVVVGIALNIFAQGITTTLYRIIFGMGSNATKVSSFEKVGAFSLPVYLALLMVIVITIIFCKTKCGLMIRGAGEYPQAIDSMGLSVNGIRYISVIAGSMVIGFGGSFLSLGELSFFTENMINGKGYIALAAVIFGRYTAVGTWLAVLVFGAGEAWVYRLQAANIGVPTQIILMIPYLLTVVVVAVFGKKGSGPMALGIPFSKEEKM